MVEASISRGGQTGILLPVYDQIVMPLRPLIQLLGSRICGTVIDGDYFHRIMGLLAKYGRKALIDIIFDVIARHDQR